MGISADDAIFGSVRVTLNGEAVRNLFSSTLEIVNESANDVENLPITVYAGNVSLLSEKSEIVDTTRIVPHSLAYKEAIKIKPGEHPSDEQRKLWASQREYTIPVLNRGQTARFTYLCIAHNGLQPALYVDIQHKGALAEFRPAAPKYMGVPYFNAALTGSVVALAALVALAPINPAGTAIGIVCLVYGLFAVIPGAMMYRAYRKLKNWMIG
jgi:hypothetical protein